MRDYFLRIASNAAFAAALTWRLESFAIFSSVGTADRAVEPMLPSSFAALMRFSEESLRRSAMWASTSRLLMVCGPLGRLPRGPDEAAEALGFFRPPEQPAAIATTTAIQVLRRIAFMPPAPGADRRDGDGITKAEAVKFPARGVGDSGGIGARIDCGLPCSGGPVVTLSPPAVRRVVALSPDDGAAIDLRNPIVAGVLSWLVPGLGQLYQRRTLKGLIMMLPILATVLAGLWLSAGRAASWDPRPESGRQRLLFLATQGEIGCLALPVIASGILSGGRGQDVSEWQRRLGRYYDIGWLYTVIAGFMNLLVIYDALCGPMRAADRVPADGEPDADDPGRHVRPER